MSPCPLTEDQLREEKIGAFFRPSQLEAVGISYDQLRRMVASGQVEQVARGLYRLASAELTEHCDLAAVSARIPRSIICLLTALVVHGIGTQVPREIWIAIPHKARPPRLPEYPIRLLRFSGPAWTYGIQATTFEGVPARITSPARTIVDCFRFERLVGREAAMEALSEVLRHRRVSIDAIMRVLEVLPCKLLTNALQTIDL